jgi:hypothetical protein
MQVNLVAPVADTPTTWDDPLPMSTLHAILLFVGVPLALFVGIALLAMAPSIIKGPRYRPGEEWNAEPEWFGAPIRRSDASARPELEANKRSDEESDQGAGGASAGW